MKIEQELTSYLNAKIKNNKEKISNIILKILGISAKKELDYLSPIYAVDKENLELILEMENLSEQDEILIKYFLSKLKNENKYYIGHYGELNNSTIRRLINNNSFVINLDERQEIKAFAFEQKLYIKTLSKDINYILNLLILLGITKKENSFCLTTADVKINSTIPNASNLIYSELLVNLAIQIVIELHSANIYIFDAKNESEIEELHSNIPTYFTTFYTLFKDIIYLLITNYKKFIEILGTKNFEEFTELILTGNIYEIESILEKMYIQKKQNENISIDINRISDSLLKLYKK